MKRTSWQIVRKCSLVFFVALVLDWVLLLGGVLYFAIADGPSWALLFLRRMDDVGPSGPWDPTDFIVEQVGILILTVASGVLAVRSRKHLEATQS